MLCIVFLVSQGRFASADTIECDNQNSKTQQNAKLQHAHGKRMSIGGQLAEPRSAPVTSSSKSEPCPRS
jgi:hypothetical protein